MNDCDRVLERLYERRDIGKHLELHDFADLGLSNRVIQECLEGRHALELVFVQVHKNSRDNSGVDRIVAQITEKGNMQFKRYWRDKCLRPHGNANHVDKLMLLASRGCQYVRTAVIYNRGPPPPIQTTYPPL